VPLIPDRLRNTATAITMAPNTLILQYWVIGLHKFIAKLKKRKKEW